MAKYELDNQILQNLIVFLNRTQLSGSEVQEFNKIMYVLSNPIKEEDQENK